MTTRTPIARPVVGPETRFVPDPRGRVPPNDLDAERAVLSAVLLDADALDEVRDTLTPEDFYSGAHGTIYDAACALASQSKPVDLITVHTWLKDRGQLQAVGGAAYLADISDATPSVAHVGEHAATVREKARLRRTIEMCHRFAAEGYGDVGDADNWIQSVEAQMFQAANDGAIQGLIPMRQVIHDAFSDIKRRDESGTMAGRPSGLRDLDTAIGGLVGGELIVVAGRPGMAKTALAQCMKTAVARSGAGVAGFSLEMPTTQLGTRFACTEAGVDGSRIRAGKVGADNWSRITDAAVRLAELPISLDCTSDQSVTAIRSKVRRYRTQLARQKLPLGLVVVDYLQLLNCVELGRNASREREIAFCSRSLKQLALELEVPVVVLSQLNRGVESRPDKRPLLSDLRESGAIEQDADVVLMLYRHEYYHDDAPEVAQGVCEIDVVKARSGRTGAVYVHFDGPTTRFGDLDHGWRDSYRSWRREK